MENKTTKHIICYYSDDLFNGYQIVIEAEKINTNTVEECKISLIEYCYNDLLLHLKKFKLNQLELKLKEKKNTFHVHDPFDLLKVYDQNIYICSH